MIISVDVPDELIERMKRYWIIEETWIKPADMERYREEVGGKLIPEMNDEEFKERVVEHILEILKDTWS